MITPDAKCVVNGDKLNETIGAVNPLLNMDIIVGQSETPQVKYSKDGVQFVLPPSGGASANEELDVVDSNNAAARRWFFTSDSAGSGGGEDIVTSGGVNDMSPQNKADNAPVNKKRNQLNAGGAQGAGGGGAGAPGADRNKLQNRGANGGGGGNNGVGAQANIPGNATQGGAGSSGASGYRPNRKPNTAAKKPKSIMDMATEKRQKAADKMHADNQMKDVAAGRATLTAGGIEQNRTPTKSVEQQMDDKRQAAADATAEANRMIWKYGKTGSKAKGTQHYQKYAHKKKFGGGY